MWDVMDGHGDGHGHPLMSCTIRGSCLFVTPARLFLLTIDRQLIDYRRLESPPPQDSPAIGKSDHPDGCD